MLDQNWNVKAPERRHLENLDWIYVFESHRFILDCPKTKFAEMSHDNHSSPCLFRRCQIINRNAQFALTNILPVYLNI